MRTKLGFIILLLCTMVFACTPSFAEQSLQQVNKQRQVAKDKIYKLKLLEKIETNKLYSNQQRLQKNQKNLHSTKQRLVETQNNLSNLENKLNLVPFKTIRNYMTALEIGNISETVVRNNLIGNFLLFLPMGYFLPTITKTRNFFLIEVKILIIIFLVEVIQLITGLGSFDIDDIILNFVGSIIGYGIYYFTSIFIRKTDR